MGYRKILIPVDFSPCSEEAFRVASELAERFGAALLTVHVIDEKLVNAVAVTGDLEKEKVAKVFHEKARQHFHDFLEKRTSSVPVIRKLLVGAPFSEIVKLVRTEGIDLVVIGRYGGTGELEKIFFGSTAEKVVRFAPCAVLAVPLPPQREGKARCEKESMGRSLQGLPGLESIRENISRSAEEKL